MRTLLLAAVVVGTAASGQAISGTVTATYTGSDQGVPQVKIDVSLACSLTCDASAPVKHYAIVAGLKNYYSAAPTEAGRYSALLSADLDLDGQASVVSTAFKVGSTTFVKAESVTCHCGNRNGEGGFINLMTGPVVVPAGLVQESSARVGDTRYLSAAADLRGAEQVELKVEGGGLNQSKTFGVADLNGQGYAVYETIFTEPGTAKVTAILRPSGVESSMTFPVTPRSSSGSGGGGGASGTGGGGGGEGEPSGCSSVGALSVLSALALVRLRRSRR